MSHLQKLLIQGLMAYHKKSVFKSGEPSLDIYIQKQASQDIKRNLCKVFVATSDQNPTEILGYYSLSSLSIAFEKLPANISKKLPRYPIPAALLGRLAVSESAQKNGIGEAMLVDAIKRVKSIDQIGIFAIVVDTLNVDVIPFYEKYGFLRLETDTTQLFLPLKSFDKYYA